jgi:hypothetical protein
MAKDNEAKPTQAATAPPKTFREILLERACTKTLEKKRNEARWKADAPNRNRRNAKIRSKRLRDKVEATQQPVKYGCVTLNPWPNGIEPPSTRGSHRPGYYRDYWHNVQKPRRLARRLSKQLETEGQPIPANNAENEKMTLNWPTSEIENPTLFELYDDEDMQIKDFRHPVTGYIDPYDPRYINGPNNPGLVLNGVLFDFDKQDRERPVMLKLVENEDGTTSTYERQYINGPWVLITD